MVKTINVNNQRVTKILKAAHEKMLPKLDDDSADINRFVLGNQLISLLCLHPEAGPTELSRYMYEKYAFEVSPDEVISELRGIRLANPEERKPLFRWLQTIVEEFGEALCGDQTEFNSYLKNKKSLPLETGSKRREHERILLQGIFTLLNGIDSFGDHEKLMKNGNARSRYCLYDLEDAVALEYGFKLAKSKKVVKETKAREQKLTYEQAMGRIEELETSLERINAMLKDLQDEFDEQIAETKTQELTEFFGKLNSDKYGRLLDELFVLRKGISTLRAQNYELPSAINGLMIMATKLLQFVKDSHIDPIMKVNSMQIVKARDIETCNYEGSPFKDNNEEKIVRVISPGWIYRDKQIQISRPQVKEEN